MNGKWLRRRFPYLTLLLVIITVVLLYLVGVRWVSAQPPAPVPLLPRSNTYIIVPTFSWQSSTGAEYYEIQVGPQANINSVYWTDTTYNLNLTPNNSQNLPNEALYWRVRAYDNLDQAGSWSSRVNFTKYIPAPHLVSPHDHIALVEPAFDWDPVEGAASYVLEVSHDATFNVVDYTYTTYDTHLTPNNTLTHGTFYWRVRGVDADGHAGTNSAVNSFVKHIPAPLLVSPADGSTIVIPTFEWLPAQGSVSYQVDITSDATFNTVDNTYTTLQTRFTPAQGISNGTLYWRVRGLDADNHAGTFSEVRAFTKHIPAPGLVSPADGSTISEPFLSWQAVDGAVKYTVELSTASSFVPIAYSYTTHNLQLTPNSAVSPGTYYWRVRGSDSEGNGGTNSVSGTFTLVAQPVASGTTPQLQTPSEGENLINDPTFRWTRIAGAASYRLVVSTSATFSSVYDAVITVYSSYVPYTPGTRYTYASGTYYWEVEARSSTGAVIATSTARSFSKQMPVLLSGPADGVTLPGDATFQWTAVVGAETYHLVVSTSPTFASSYDSVNVDYVTYTPYSAGTRNTYVNGTYYWKVEAKSSTGTLIGTSPARNFTKQASLPLTTPENNAHPAVDPSFQWGSVIAAARYFLRVSTSPTFASTYDSLTTEYFSYTPSDAGSKYVYVNGTYYWRMEAESTTGGTIVTSQVYSFTKTTDLTLLSPVDNFVMGNTPTFQWTWVVGAKNYYLQVSTSPMFSSSYDSVTCDYPTYTPYTPGTRDTYLPGTYYWRVMAKSNTGGTITTSRVGVFTISSTEPTSTPFGAPTATATPTRTITPTPTSTGPTPTVTPLGSWNDGGNNPTNKKLLGAVTIYADTFTDLSGNRWEASGNVRLGTDTATYVDIGPGNAILDYNAMSISGTDESLVALLMDGNKLNPLFLGPFSVNANTGILSPQSVTYQLDRLGDMGIDLSIPLVGFQMNVLLGTVSGTVTILAYPVEDDCPYAEVSFTLSHDGHVAGDLGLGDLEFEVAGLTISVEDATLSYDPVNGGKITIASASVSLPEELDLGVGATGTVEDIEITRDGLQVGGLGITLELPNMAIPGTDGEFELAGGEVTLFVRGNGEYYIFGRVEFSLPNLDLSGGSLVQVAYQPEGANLVNDPESVNLYAEFELDQDGLSYVMMGGEADPGVPIGQTGLELTGLEGRVDLVSSRVQITGTIESSVEIEPLGALISGEPTIWFEWGDDLGMGIEGSVKVLIFDAAQVSLSISQSEGLRGSVHVNYPPYALMGDGALHVWCTGGCSEFHFTGSATVTLGFTKGALGEFKGVSIPPGDFTFGSVGAQFGEFCANSTCSSSVYGFKGSLDVTFNAYCPRWGIPPWRKCTIPLVSYAIFFDLDGNLDYGSSLDQYRLVDQAEIQALKQAQGLAPSSTDVITFTVSNTDLTFAGLEWENGDPAFTLIDPEGTPIITTTVYTGMAYTSTTTSMTYFIQDPKQGTWQAVIGNLSGSENYSFQALGRNLPPTVTAGAVSRSATESVDSYVIHWTAYDSDPETSLALYYDSNNSGEDGRLIAKGLNPAAGSYTWDTSMVPTGEYYLYARVDDLKNLPVVSYYTDTVSVANTQPPATPMGIQVTVSANGKNLRVCWNGNSEADVVGYNVYFGSAAGLYDLGLHNAYLATCHNLTIPPWLDYGYVAVSAYDNSGNESILSTELIVKVNCGRPVYLPFIAR